MNDAADQPRLRLRGVTKRYGRHTVLDGVDLDVHAGQLTAVVGANGSGKSTLLAICAGLLRPDRGTVEVDGSVGLCPQAGGVADLLLADEHFVLFGAGRRLGRQAARRHGRRLAATLDWAPASQVAGKLSGGTRQKLNVVLAALGDPAVLLLDEPYQGFDQNSYDEFWDWLAGWCGDGGAAVVVTHLLHDLDRVDAVVDLGPAAGEAARRAS
jgi:ABC-type multidrug transport system ATPase subunit